MIILSIGWGWLFAMGGLALLHDSASVIVIGISSVILGIAVNYPLHLIAHLQHTPDIKSALK
jgi:predicted RND superfamily exporter protein